jgi:hypothetical protein
MEEYLVVVVDQVWTKSILGLIEELSFVSFLF